MLALVLVSAAPAAPSSAEKRRLKAADDSFNIRDWARAAEQFAAFAADYPQSELRPQAWLREAQALYYQNQFEAAAELLTAHRGEAHAQADAFQLWLGEIHYANSNYLAAATAFDQLVRDYPGSSNVLNACYGAALARSQMSDWVAVTEELSRPDGVFHAVAAANPANELVQQGWLLLGEAQLERQEFSAAQTNLQALADRKLPPTLDWRRQFLWCRLQLATGHPAEALTGVTNLLALARTAGQRDLLAESAMLQGGILTQLQRYDEAVAAYEQNLAADLPLLRRRQALVKIVELLLSQNQVAAASQRLEKFIDQYRQDPAADVVLMMAGKLHLKQYLAQPSASRIDLAAITNAAPALPDFTNDLQQAYAQFDWVTANFPQSTLRGEALLDRAWCLWLAGQIPDSQAAFQLAAEQPPVSTNQAMARYKWADCQMQQGDFAGALTNYNYLLDYYADTPAVHTNLFEPALYQMVRAGLGLNDLAAATNALGRILTEYPDGYLCNEAMLLAGQEFNRRGDPAGARNLFAEALKRFPQSTLAPQLQLAMARTYEQEANWPAAVAAYDQWVTNHAGLPDLPQVEFSRAWDTSRAGQQTNALNLFTNFVARFATNDLAPLAQNWVADYYFSLGDYTSAEAGYQLVYKNPWLAPASSLYPITYQAKLMAGRAAAARQGYAEAVGYFTLLTSDTNCPATLKAQALFEYGTTEMLMESTGTNGPLANYSLARSILNQIQVLYPTNPLVPLAWGEIGMCCLQLATADPKYYGEASNAFQQVLLWPGVEVPASSRAEVGLGLVLEKMAAARATAEQLPLLEQALGHYLNVMQGVNLAADQKADALWVKKAGLEAARLAERLGRWQEAVKIYTQLGDQFPMLKDMLAKKIAKVQENLPATPPAS